MKIKQKVITTLLFNALAFFSISSWSAVQLIAAVGQSAEDFPSGFIYSDIGTRDAALGSSGHVAFWGIADTNDGSTGNRTNVVWSGLPGQLKAIIKENESPEGFQENVLFEGALVDEIIVNRSGDVAFFATMKGAATGQALLLYRSGGNTQGVLMLGSQAPGFPSGTNVLRIDDFSLSDAGMAISATVGSSTMGGFATWFYDFENLTLLTSPVPGCDYMSISNINDSGVIAFGGLYDDGCDIRGKVDNYKWFNGQWERLISGAESGVPNMVDTVFTLPGVPLINDLGGVAFSTTMADLSSGRGYGIWVIDETDVLKLTIFGGELLANNSGVISPFTNFFNTTSSVFTNDNFLITTVHTSNGNNDALLAGFPKNTQPYTSLRDINGTSQLTVVAQVNQRPPGFESTWFYKELGESIAVNRTGQFIFTGAVSDATTGNQTIAFWRADKDNINPRLKAIDQMKITVNGEEHVMEINRANFLETSMTLGGKVSRFSDNGHFLFDGIYSGIQALFLLLDDNKEQRIFSLAEQKFPQFFSPANVEDRLIEGFEYRFYPDTKTYIGIKNNTVFVLGDVFGPGLRRIGTIDETLQVLEGS